MLEHSAATPWYEGESLLQHLETVQVDEAGHDTGFRMPVQWVCRPDHAFRGFAGTVVAGELVPGDAIAVLPSGQRSKVARIVTAGGALRPDAHTSELQSLMRNSYAVFCLQKTKQKQP